MASGMTRSPKAPTESIGRKDRFRVERVRSLGSRKSGGPLALCFVHCYYRVNPSLRKQRNTCKGPGTGVEAVHDLS